MRKALLPLALMIGSFTSPAFAAPFTYAPETCEFKITYPEKPYIEQKCTTGDTKVCSEVVTYTKVISAETSVNVRVSCSKHDAKELEKYTPEIMKETVQRMTSQAKMDVEDIKTTEIEGYKSASAVNIGERGGRDILYTAQVWMGKTSLFTIEADMTGPQDAQADALFTDILKSMQPKSVAAKEIAKPKP